MEDQHEVYEEYEESWTGRIAIAGVVALALIAGAFFGGKAMAGGGPATLAEAVEQAEAGDLPCGDSAATATPTGTPDAAGARAGGAGFMLRAVCAPDGQQAAPERRPSGAFGGQTGMVKALSATSLTLSGPNGDTTIKLDGATTISKNATADSADLKPGQSVIVAGAGPNNPGGAATSVTILPSGGGN